MNKTFLLSLVALLPHCLQAWPNAHSRADGGTARRAANRCPSSLSHIH